MVVSSRWQMMNDEVINICYLFCLGVRLLGLYFVFSLY